MILCTDRVEISGVEARPNGFVVVSARVARAGNVQDYTGAEVGKPSLAKVRVYRPESEVFDKAAVKTLAHKPVTLEHPSEFVTADNWHKTAVGWIGEDIMRDGEFLRVPMTIAAQRAIGAVKDGQRELSVGYQCDLEWGQGTTPAGEIYDAKQTNILVDHVAIVERGRAGPECRIGDWRNPVSDHDTRQAKGITTMTTLKTIVVDGLPAEMSDMAASIVQRHIDSLNRQLADAKKIGDDFAEELKKKKAESEAKDGKIATLEKQATDSVVTPAKLDALVKDRMAVIDKARKILGDKAVTDGKSEAEIRRSVVVAKLGDAVATPMSDAAIEGAFATLTVDTKAADADPVVKALSTGPAADARNAAHADYTKRLGDAWRTPAARA